MKNSSTAVEWNHHHIKNQGPWEVAKAHMGFSLDLTGLTQLLNVMSVIHPSYSLLRKGLSELCDKLHRLQIFSAAFECTVWRRSGRTSCPWAKAPPQSPWSALPRSSQLLPRLLLSPPNPEVSLFQVSHSGVDLIWDKRLSHFKFLLT